MRCSEFNCQVRICKKCYDYHDENIVTYIDQPVDHIVSGNTIDGEDEEDKRSEESEDNDEEEINKEVDEEEQQEEDLQSNNELFGDGDECHGHADPTNDNYLNEMEDVYSDNSTSRDLI